MFILVRNYSPRYSSIYSTGTYIFCIAQFPLLDPDSYIEYGSGSRRRFEYRFTRIRNTDAISFDILKCIWDQSRFFHLAGRGVSPAGSLPNSFSIMAALPPPVAANIQQAALFNTCTHLGIPNHHQRFSWKSFPRAFGSVWASLLDAVKYRYP